MFEYFCDFVIDFSSVDKHRRFRLRHDCVGIVDGVVFDVVAAQVEEPRKIVKGRNKSHVATLMLCVIAQIGKFACHAFARNLVDKIIRGCTFD